MKRHRSWAEILNDEGSLVAHKLKCTTCDSRTTVLGDTIPNGWARDGDGNVHCLKCWRLAKAMIVARDTSGE